jgi:hypothetical protein
MNNDKELKTLNAHIPVELHKKLRIKLIQDDKTYRDWVIDQIKAYLNEN